MGGSETVPATRAGRPRRFEAEDELRILLDAALAVMERNGYVDAAVADILREADLSTRSFYRHFESKDQLLCALYRREAEAAVARLQEKVDAAADPRAALDAWIDEILSFGHHRAKAARVAVLGSAGAMRAEGYADETRRAATLLMAPLQTLLAEGVADGSFPLADPVADARAGAVRGLGRRRAQPDAGEAPAGRGLTAGALVLRACAGGIPPGLTGPDRPDRPDGDGPTVSRPGPCPSATTAPARRPRPRRCLRSRAPAGATPSRPPRPGA